MTNSLGITPRTTETIMTGTVVGGTAGRRGTRVVITGDKNGIITNAMVNKMGIGDREEIRERTNVNVYQRGKWIGETRPIKMTHTH
jgi:hypothetical protein